MLDHGKKTYQSALSPGSRTSSIRPVCSQSQIVPDTPRRPRWRARLGYPASGRGRLWRLIEPLLGVYAHPPCAILVVHLASFAVCTRQMHQGNTALRATGITSAITKSTASSPDGDNITFTNGCTSQKYSNSPVASNVCSELEPTRPLSPRVSTLGAIGWVRMSRLRGSWSAMGRGDQ